MRKTLYPKEVLELAAKQSICYVDMFRFIGARVGGNTYQRVKLLIQEYGIDVSHFAGKRAGGIKTALFKKKSPEEILKSNQPRRINSQKIRRALREYGEPYVCKNCGLAPKWNGKPLTLQVDHINGDWSDCRPDNLRFLCPNCHTQEPTFCNQGKHTKCSHCGRKINSGSKWCKRCSDYLRDQSAQRKVKNRPSLDTLLRETEQMGFVAVGKKYGVSDNAIRKWIRVEKIRKDLLHE